MSTDEDARKLFVAGLPETITDDALRSVFEESGAAVIHLSMPRDRATGRPRGFAFVTFSTPEAAGEARAAVDGTLLEGRSISVRPFSSEPPARGERVERGHPGAGGGPERPRPARDDPNRTLYVGNLPYDIEESELQAILTEKGSPAPQRVHLPADHATGRKRGFAFINFGSEVDAQAALTALGGLAIKGRNCAVHIAHPKGERPARGDRPERPGGFGGGGGGGFGGGPPDFGGKFDMPPGGAPGPQRRRRTGGGGDEFERPERKRKGGGRKSESRERGGGNHGRYQNWSDDDEF